MTQVLSEQEQQQPPAIVNFLESLSSSKDTRKTYLKSL
jgi:hypothetical protein